MAKFCQALLMSMTEMLGRSKDNVVDITKDNVDISKNFWGRSKDNVDITKDNVDISKNFLGRSMDILDIRNEGFPWQRC